jgi:pyruvate,water dikinase
MTTYHFVWLGSKRAKKNGVAEEGWRLDMAARAGLPVPNGGILLDYFYWLAVQEAVVQLVDGRAHILSPPALYDLLYTAVRFPQLDKPCIIRPLFGTAVSPQLHLNMSDPVALAVAFGQLWQAAPAGEESRHDLLVQEMIAIQVEGTAVTAAHQPTDTITYAGNTITLPQLTGWRRPDAAQPHQLRRLQQLLRGVRRTFGAGEWQVQWADDGRICWLLTIIPNA